MIQENRQQLFHTGTVVRLEQSLVPMQCSTASLTASRKKTHEELERRIFRTDKVDILEDPSIAASEHYPPGPGISTGFGRTDRHIKLFFSCSAWLLSFQLDDILSSRSCLGHRRQWKSQPPQ